MIQTANYLFSHYKGKYRVEANYDKTTNDVPRDSVGNINKSYDDTYIACSGGGQIYHYGGNKLVAYIPYKEKFKPRGKKLVKDLQEAGIKIYDILATDSELEFKFTAKDIDIVASKMKVRTTGASTSPYSNKRFSKNKSVIIPQEELQRYKEITNVINEKDKLLIHRFTQAFLDEIVAKKYRCQSVKADMKLNNLARQTKEYIWFKGVWEEYLGYMKKKLEDYYEQYDASQSK